MDLNMLVQWSSLPVQAQARGKSLPELRKACGLTGLLVSTEERALGARISRIICGNNYLEYRFISTRPLSLQLPRRRSLDVAVSITNAGPPELGACLGGAALHTGFLYLAMPSSFLPF
jgi:hypothetical protein